MVTLKIELRKILERYGIDPRDKSQLWDCHGTLVLYHRAYEIIAAKEGITFDPPTLIESDGANKVVAMLVVGRWKDRSEWSIGEAAPGNSKNSYPYAIAEKRAKDRVVAKLVGLAAHVYSEDEADEFKELAKAADTPPPAALSLDALRAIAKRIAVDIDGAETGAAVDDVLEAHKADLEIIKLRGQKTYEAIIAKGLARQNKLRAGA